MDSEARYQIEEDLQVLRHQIAITDIHCRFIIFIYLAQMKTAKQQLSNFTKRDVRNVFCLKTPNEVVKKAITAAAKSKIICNFVVLGEKANSWKDVAQTFFSTDILSILQEISVDEIHEENYLDACQLIEINRKLITIGRKCSININYIIEYLFAIFNYMQASKLNNKSLEEREQSITELQKSIGEILYKFR